MNYDFNGHKINSRNFKMGLGKTGSVRLASDR